MSKVILTLEFPNVIAAADALQRLSGAQVLQAVALPPLVVYTPDVVTDTASVLVPDAQSLPSQPTTEKPARKPRADAGKPRGPHKDTGGAAAGQQGSNPGPSTTDTAAPAQPVAQAQEAQRAEPAAPTAADPNAKLTKEDATAALGRMNKTSGLGMPACIEHLKLFGVNRISVLPEKDFALFIKQADEKIAEHLAAAAKAK